MSGFDAQGVYQYGETDTFASESAKLNALGASLSTQFGIERTKTVLAAGARTTTAQSTQASAGAFAVVIWNSDVYSSGLVSGTRLTVTKAGMYMVIGKVRVPSVNDGYGSFYINGVYQPQWEAGAATLGTFLVAGLLKLKAGDYLELGFSRLGNGAVPIAPAQTSLDATFLGLA